MQALADAEPEPQAKQAYIEKAEEMDQWAEVASLQRKLEKAIREHKKAGDK
ncbi:hypothetical protein NMC40_18815 [Proteus mirabilis]|nr:hypothetical protein [Proteus mirabilis]